ncbi:hypothetical protein Ddye_026151 [Dipteronia dyeriana]|uniref:No apical meristem-associated C-terminal domain-containing protein n=1 Tax=Dipteronia dyeriana TaxID=168575 RepID=A0AAD9WP94_9ROSI|nr:hypothetical protein Ddye_026151 [Dipteronia dyeriana]
MSSGNQSSGYTNEDDIHLCHVYLDVSQNPIIGTNQSRDQFWSRVESDYNNLKAEFITELRAKRSLQCRMQTILTSVNKLRGCVRQIENLHPNSASDQDIMHRAKALLMQDKKYIKGFKFDHVWSILKDIPKFSNDTSLPQLSQKWRVDICSSQSNSPSTESPTSPNLASSTFSLHLIDEDILVNSSQRPVEVKKAKLKRIEEEQHLNVLESIKQNSKEIKGIFKKSTKDRRKNFILQMIAAKIEAKKWAVKELREEQKIFQKDLSSEPDLAVREYYQTERIRILAKKAQQG